jgi:hypothetical protein
MGRACSTNWGEEESNNKPKPRRQSPLHVTVLTKELQTKLSRSPQNAQAPTGMDILQTS